MRGGHEIAQAQGSTFTGFTGSQPGTDYNNAPDKNPTDTDSNVNARVRAAIRS